MPKGRGFAPIQNTILSGSNELTFSIIEAKSEVDSGRIFLQKKIKLDGSELYDELRKIQGRETLNLINSFLSKFPDLAPVDQKGRATYFPRRTPNDSELDVSKSILEQFNILRVVNNEEWPAFFYYQGKKFILKIYQD